MTRRLFVYGTLRSDGPAHRSLIAPLAVSVEPASLIDHALYGIGLPYPFVAAMPGMAVTGEVVHFDARYWPDLTHRLDEYEGDHYVRVEAAARIAEEAIRVQVYVAADHVELAPESLVSSGDWSELSS
jgi:gamma-glutamylcyclotransferase (GGCT)/AIG2-like uncharacterized protein YtfP